MDSRRKDVVLLPVPSWRKSPSQRQQTSQIEFVGPMNSLRLQKVHWNFRRMLISQEGVSLGDS